MEYSWIGTCNISVRELDE